MSNSQSPRSDTKDSPKSDPKNGYAQANTEISIDEIEPEQLQDKNDMTFGDHDVTLVLGEDMNDTAAEEPQPPPKFPIRETIAITLVLLLGIALILTGYHAYINHETDSMRVFTLFFVGFLITIPGFVQGYKIGKTYITEYRNKVQNKIKVNPTNI